MHGILGREEARQAAHLELMAMEEETALRSRLEIPGVVVGLAASIGFDSPF